MMNRLSLLVVILFAVLASVVVAEEHLRIPFYVKEDEHGNVVAVIYYGNSSNNSEQIEIPCDDKIRGQGPSVIKCQKNDDDASSYNLVVPFMTVKYNDNGDVVGAIFQETKFVIPLTPKRDEHGNVIGVIYNNEQSTESSSKLTTGGIAGLILAGVAVLSAVTMFVVGLALKRRKDDTDDKPDDGTEASVVVEKAAV
mgnify:FL=1